MKPVVARDLQHLKQLVGQEVDLMGPHCSLNHIDVSHIHDFRHLFWKSPFNGDISQWNTTQATSFCGMFLQSKFNGDISSWDVSNVKDFTFMFYNSDFQGDLSSWKMSESAKWYSIYHAKAHLSNGWQGVGLPEHVLQNPAKIFPEKIHLESFFLLHPTTFNQAHVLRCLELKRKPKWMNSQRYVQIKTYQQQGEALGMSREDMAIHILTLLQQEVPPSVEVPLDLFNDLQDVGPLGV